MSLAAMAQDLARMLPPVVLMQSEDPWFSDRGEALCIAAATRHGAIVKRVDFVEAKRFEAVDKACRSIDLFQPEAIVIVRSADGLDKAGAERDALAAYCDAPVRGCTLVLKSSRTFDARTKAYKAITKSGRAWVFEPLKRWTAAKWVSERAEERGCRLGRGAADLLVELVGESAYALVNALDQAATYCGGAGLIGVDEVTAAIGATRTHDIWELFGAVFSGNTSDALDHVNALASGDSHLGVLAILTGEFRKMVAARAVMDAGGDVDSVARKVKLSPYAAKQAVERCHRLNNADIPRVFERLFAADLRLKTSAVKGLELESLVSDLSRWLGKPAARGARP